MEDGAAICPHCRLRQRLDVRPLDCPQCATALVLMEGTPSRRTVRACMSCRGIFFNPADFRVFLEHPVNTEPGGMPEPEALAQAMTYRNCPVCSEAMTPLTLTGSRALLDICRNHGIWLDAGELTRLRQWWRSEGRKNPGPLDRLVQVPKEGAGLVSAAPIVASPYSHWEGYKRLNDTGQILGIVLQVAVCFLDFLSCL